MLGISASVTSFVVSHDYFKHAFIYSAFKNRFRNFHVGTKGLHFFVGKLSGSLTDVGGNSAHARIMKKGCVKKNVLLVIGKHQSVAERFRDMDGGNRVKHGIFASKTYDVHKSHKEFFFLFVGKNKILVKLRQFVLVLAG